MTNNPRTSIYTNLAGAIPKIRRKERVKAGSLKAYRIAPLTTPVVDECGTLPFDIVQTFSEDARWSEEGLYVVFSFGTPIAWHGEKCGWVVPDVRYTVTTTRHQTVVRYAIGLAARRKK